MCGGKGEAGTWSTLVPSLHYLSKLYFTGDINTKWGTVKSSQLCPESCQTHT